MSSSVEELARSAMENLIKELQKERDVSSKERTLRMDLIDKLTDYETQKQQRLSEIKDLQSKIQEMSEHIQELMETIQSYETIKDNDNTGETDIKKDDSAGAAVSDEDTTEMDTNGDDSKRDGIDAAAITITESVSTDSEPTVAEVEPTEEKKETESSGPEINKLSMSERRRFLIQVRMILRLTFRGYFGLSFSNRWGYWLDRFMSTQIHSYADWIEYSKETKSLLLGAIGRSVIISSDGYRLFVGTKDNKIRVFDFIQDKLIDDWIAHKNAVFCLAYGRGLLVSGSSSVRVWNAYTYRLIHDLEGHERAVLSVDVNAKATRIVSASADKTVRLWCAKKGELLRIFKGHSEAVRSVYWMNEVILSGSDDKSVQVWDPSNSEPIRSITEGIGHYINQVCINCDQSLVACLLGSRGVVCCSWPEMKIVQRIQVKTYYGCFHPSNPDVLAIAHATDYSIQLYKVSSGECSTILDDHSQDINAIDFSSDGCRMVSVSDDQNCRIWNISELDLV